MPTTIDRASERTRRDVPTRGSRPTLPKVLVACGIGSSATYGIANVVGALRGDGYSSLHQSVSELTAVNAPSRPAALGIFTVSGVLALAFGIGVVASAGHNRRLRVAGWLLVGVGVADMISLFTPMHTRAVIAAGGATWTDTAHLTMTAITTLLIMGAMGFAAASAGRRFRRYCIASLVTMLVGGGLTATQKNDVAANLPTPWNGVYERIAIGSYLLWMAVLAVVLLRGQVGRQTAARTRPEAEEARP